MCGYECVSVFEECSFRRPIAVEVGLPWVILAMGHAKVTRRMANDIMKLCDVFSRAIGTLSNTSHIRRKELCVQKIMARRLEMIPSGSLGRECYPNKHWTI